MKHDIALIRLHLRYDKKTGEFWWKIRDSGRQMNKPAGALSNGYVTIGFRGKIYYAHKLAWAVVKGVWASGEIDHRDLNRGNNKWSNLRAATTTQNRCNKPMYRNNKSGFKGVSWHKQHRKWYATLQIERRALFLGLFPTAEEAYAAYVKAAKKYHKSFARFS